VSEVGDLSEDVCAAGEDWEEATSSSLDVTAGMSVLVRSVTYFMLTFEPSTVLVSIAVLDKEGTYMMVLRLTLEAMMQ
jgi:hypothetical protein